MRLSTGPRARKSPYACRDARPRATAETRETRVRERAGPRRGACGVSCGVGRGPTRDATDCTRVHFIITYFLFEARNTQQREEQSSTLASDTHVPNCSPCHSALDYGTLHCYHQREPTATHSPSVVASRDIQSHLAHYAAYYALHSSRQMREKRDAVAVQKSREREREEGCAVHKTKSEVVQKQGCQK